MGTDLTVTDTQVRQSLNGVIIHLKATDLAVNHDSFSHAMEELGLWDYAFHMAEVLAYHNADSRKLNKLLHEHN